MKLINVDTMNYVVSKKNEYCEKSKQFENAYISLFEPAF